MVSSTGQINDTDDLSFVTNLVCKLTRLSQSGLVIWKSHDDRIFAPSQHALRRRKSNLQDALSRDVMHYLGLLTRISS